MMFGFGSPERGRIILRAQAGSRLYGLARPDSDHDWYEVYDDGISNPLHVMQGDQDTTQVNVSTWLAHCARGVPQALEAMFAPARMVSFDVFKRYRLAYRADVGAAAVTYTEAIAKFMEGNTKQQFAAHRLRHDLSELRMYGRFDPTRFGRVWKPYA